MNAKGAPLSQGLVSFLLTERSPLACGAVKGSTRWALRCSPLRLRTLPRQWGDPDLAVSSGFHSSLPIVSLAEQGTSAAPIPELLAVRSQLAHGLREAVRDPIRALSLHGGKPPMDQNTPNWNPKAGETPCCGSTVVLSPSPPTLTRSMNSSRGHDLERTLHNRGQGDHPAPRGRDS